ncbi:MAG: phosphate signaling complex protein PhoU [Pseudomonadota bacterium]
MSVEHIAQHISNKFNQELEGIRSSVLSMGGLVESQLSQVITAISKRDFELAEEVATNDPKVNAYELEIDAQCTEIILRRQPAATDLRLVMSVSKTITDLERVGDEIEKVARIAADTSRGGLTSSHYVNILSMANHVMIMLRGALDAFARSDSQQALAVAQQDEAIDHENDAIMRQLITYMIEDPRCITDVLDAITVTRALERVGDHAANICENVIYYVEGKDVRHTALKDIENELKGS